MSSTDTANLRPRLQRFSTIREILDLVILVGAIYALVNLVTVRFVVQGQSMEPTFQNDQFLIVSRVNYLLGQPDYGDIVVFHAPGDEVEDYIKRITGKPGDTIQFQDTLLYRNGEIVNEPYINEACTTYNCPDRIWELGDQEYFVMGDNRNRSKDSRNFGPISRNSIVGEVLVRYWPPSDWGIVSRINYPGD